MLSEVVIGLDKNKRERQNIGSIADSVSIFCSSNSKSEFSSIFDESDENRSERHFVAFSEKFNPLMYFFSSPGLAFQPPK